MLYNASLVGLGFAFFFFATAHLPGSGDLICIGFVECGLGPMQCDSISAPRQDWQKACMRC